MAYLAVFFIVITVLVLVIGLIGFAQGGEFNKKYGNKMMRARLIFQACAVGAGLLMLLIMQSGS